jgi:hypothetical protein
VFIYKLTFLFIFLIPTFAFSNVQKGVYFYRTPQSLFSSGQTSLDFLKNSKIRTEKDHSVLINQDNKHFWLSSDKILRDTDVYVPGSLGFGINLISSTLRKEPKWTSDAVFHIPSHTKMEILKYDSGWAQVEIQTSTEKYVGYVDMNNIVIAADFASFILNKKKQWKPVLYRELSTLVLEKNERIDLGDIQALITLPNRAIVSVRNDKLGLSLRNQLQIERVEDGEWNVSQLKGHGEVFWKKESEDTVVEDEHYISTEEILKKEITSVAFHPKNPKIGLVSSEGIFLTTDGIKWKQLRSFGKLNFPVAINDAGDMIVGIFYSKNKGESFNSYMKWELLTQLIDFRAQTAIRNLQISEVDFHDTKRLRITWDTGLRKVNIAGNPDFPDSWKLTF